MQDRIIENITFVSLAKYQKMENFVCIAIYNLPTEIAVIKSILEHEGLAFFFENETIISLDPFASLAYGGIRLKVHVNDVEKVQEILKSLENDDHLKIV